MSCLCSPCSLRNRASVSLKSPVRPMTPSSIPAILTVSLTGEPSSLFPHPVSISPPLSLFPLALKSLFLTSTPPLSRALHSSSSCQTLIHSPRALTKHSLPVSLSHHALATATLLLIFIPPSSRLGFHLLVFAALVSAALCLSAHPSSFLGRSLQFLAGLFRSSFS